MLLFWYFFFIEGRMKMNGSQKRGPASQSMGGTFLQKMPAVEEPAWCYSELTLERRHTAMWEAVSC